jgi:hypothetical protein
MRVLLSCLQSSRLHPIPAYKFWRSYFVKGLEEAGHEVLELPEVDWVEGFLYSVGPQLSAWRDRAWETVLSFARREHSAAHIDMFLGYLYPRQIETSAIKELRRLGIPCVNFFCDNVREFRTVPSEYRCFDLHWVPEFEALPMYRAAGLDHVHAPMPCWVPSELRSPPSAESEPPTFIGSADILRRELFGRALELGADFTIRGQGWRPEDTTAGGHKGHSPKNFVVNQIASFRVHGPMALVRKVQNTIHPLRAARIPTANVRDAPIDQNEYFRLSREAEVTIGVNRVPTATGSDRQPRVYSRLRDIEAPMLGACYLTEWTEGLGKLFDLGEEIDTYRTAAELRDKLAELAKHADRRVSMRRRAQQRATHDHTVARSIARIMQKLGRPAG